MSEIRVDSAEVEAAFRRAGVSVLQRIDVALSQGALLVQREWVRLVPKGEGTLLRNIHTGRIAFLEHEIVSGAQHAGFVERGTGLYGPSHIPPRNGMLSDQGVAGIAQWIRRKGIVPRPGVTVLQLPWLIARKIARDGTKAQPTREQAKTSQEPRIHELVRMATAQGLADAGFQVS